MVLRQRRHPLPDRARSELQHVRRCAGEVPRARARDLKLMDSTNPDLSEVQARQQALLKDNAQFCQSASNTIAYYKAWSAGWARIPSIASCGSTSTRARRTPWRGERHRWFSNCARGRFPGGARRLGDEATRRDPVQPRRRQRRRLRSRRRVNSAAIRLSALSGRPANEARALRAGQIREGRGGLIVSSW
jgi:hypothetical protein